MLAKFHPLARMGEISDIVGAVLYLQEATFVTGENIHVDGGVHGRTPLILPRQPMRVLACMNSA